MLRGEQRIDDAVEAGTKGNGWGLWFTSNRNTRRLCAKPALAVRYACKSPSRLRGVETVDLLGGNPILGESAMKAVQQWVYAAAAWRTKLLVRFAFDPQ